MPHPTALVMHPDCGRHDTGWGHPDHQGRLPAIVKAISRDSPSLIEAVLQREAEPVSDDDLGRVHTPEHIERVRRAARRSSELGEPVYLDPETPVSPASWDAARAAAGCAVTGAELVLSGEAETAFAAARPPGHHAMADKAMGFCLFNNVAIAARWIQAHSDLKRVLILDWDAHHGNGTQQIFYEDPTVYYLSLHVSPHYPGTGSRMERGVGAGAGMTRNVPLPIGTSAEAYMEAFEEAVTTTVEHFLPEFILVSAGFDVLHGDPLGGLKLEQRDVHRLSTVVAQAAREVADGRMVAVMEGGYSPDRVGDAVVNTLRALTGHPPKD